MNNYYAVVKYSDTSGAMTTGTFAAKNHPDAITKMAKMAGVQDTMNLHEYELLMIKGKEYIVVARKFGRAGPQPMPKPSLETEKLPVIAAPKEGFSTIAKFKVSTL